MCRHSVSFRGNFEALREWLKTFILCSRRVVFQIAALKMIGLMILLRMSFSGALKEHNISLGWRAVFYLGRGHLEIGINAR